jgi:hypothetical protein
MPCISSSPLLLFVVPLFVVLKRMLKYRYIYIYIYCHSLHLCLWCHLSSVEFEVRLSSIGVMLIMLDNMSLHFCVGSLEELGTVLL